MLKYLGTDGKTDDTHEEVSRLSPLLVNPIYTYRARSLRNRLVR